MWSMVEQNQTTFFPTSLALSQPLPPNFFEIYFKRSSLKQNALHHSCPPISVCVCNA